MAIAPSINLSKVSSGINSLNIGMGQLKKSADNIKTVSLNKTKIKRESIARSKMFSKMREEAVKRKDQESIIEASGINGAFKRTSSVITDSTKGFLGRILDFASSLLIGWLLYNLPTIITAIEDLITRIKSLYGILTDFISNITDTFQNFGQLLSGVYYDITHFDFTDQSKRVQSAMDDLGANVGAMHDQFEDGFKLLTTPLGQLPGEETPAPLNTDYTQPAPTTGGGQDLYTLATISGLESGYAQGQADVAQSIYNRMKQSGKGVVDVTTSPGQYQPFFGKGGGVDPESKNIKTFDDAVKYRMKKTGENRETAERSILSTIAAIQDPTKQASAREFVGTKTSFRGSPQNTGNTLGNVSWRGGRSDNQFLNEANVSGTPGNIPSFVSSPNKGTEAGTTPSAPKSGKGNGYLTSADLVKVKSLSQTPDYKDWYGNSAMLNPAAAKAFSAAQSAFGKDIPINSAYRSYAHQQSIQQSGKYAVVAAPGTSRHGMGLALDLEPGTPSYNWMMKNGSKFGWFYAGIPDDKFHFEYRGGGATIPQIASSQSSTLVSSKITPEKKGQQIMVVDDRQPSAPQQVSSGGGGGGDSQSIPVDDSLNSLIKHQILLELAYT